MKRIFLVIAAVAMLVSCNHKDGAWLSSVYDLDSRVSYLESLCGEMNTNITAIQTIIEAQESGDYITSVTEVKKDGEVIGYTIAFKQRPSITIYHGANGKDGQNGSDGKDGSTPNIGVKVDTDGVYYWTLNGEWILDGNGNKMRVTGEKGEQGEKGDTGATGQNGQDGQNGTNGTNGTNGQDGITPQFKIENDYWYISYNNGSTWTQLGKAKGDKGDTGATGLAGTNGTNGQNGDNIFQSVTQDANNVYFIMKDGTVITIKKSGYSSENADMEMVQIVDGAIMAPFSISMDREVYFSKGNLQYQASTNTWRFAEHQYDVVWDRNMRRSSTYDGWIDLFGWGTSGYHDPENPKNVYYQPYLFPKDSILIKDSKYNYSSSSYAIPPEYYGYGPKTGGLAGTNYDWGVYNPISNGGNQPGLWRTLTAEEWDYLLNQRHGVERYFLACIAGVNGIIILPDNWIIPDGVSYTFKDDNGGCHINTFTISQWRTLERSGAVFLPDGGFISQFYDGTTIQLSSGLSYWASSTQKMSMSSPSYMVNYAATCLMQLHPSDDIRIDAYARRSSSRYKKDGYNFTLSCEKSSCLSVRLVKDVK